ncbi:MAG: PIN domain-containing protein [Verrucomicrobia bacterium]|jgi:predicted nucleic acid-binding protein|nr:PIN domain-containing protein [Verrucomicrobiota bacterium]OQC66979.1 MAG: tRNA(fMet)-specific endonuclease VapC [Verrucomicrobia bacterium ADurb.Bin006]MDI9381320.1 PIN domain-containing protein [Verrucomicrobiota bacterium]NMD21328.1 PIN domain-containing protein [Verrucomicrobiota bacterium]HNU98519.1 PIN domain-containing protein [Verrucomicrobiota bacterium]
MPAVDVLFDSNVLLYALSDAPGERAKRDQAVFLIATENFGTSYQVVMETWVVATRKMERRVAPAKLSAFLERILVFPCVPGTDGLYRQAFRLAERLGVHPYDAAILAAAQELGARRVLSEDFNDGQDYDGVRVINPFRGLGGRQR